MFSLLRTYERKRIRRSVAEAKRQPLAYRHHLVWRNVVGKMHTAGLKGEPLAAIQPELRKEWLETLDRELEALCPVRTGLAEAMNTLKAQQSEPSEFPLNLPVPDLGQPVLNLATDTGGVDLDGRVHAASSTVAAIWS
jgi:hypothetical protein